MTTSPQSILVHPPRPLLNDVIVALADEGVPVRAIARASRVPGVDVYEVLQHAVTAGRLVEIPQDDWPRGKRADRSQACKAVLQQDDQVLRSACSNLFRMTRLQAAVFVTILRRPEITKDQLHAAIETTRPDSEDPTDKKMVDVVVCHIRKKLKLFSVFIDTIWGTGYSMKPEQREAALSLIDQHLAIVGVAA